MSAHQLVLLSGDAELVALGVREHEPRLTELLASSRRDARRTKVLEAMDLVLKVLHEQVEMHPVLHSLGLCNPLQGEGDTMSSQGDIPTLDTSVHDESDRGLPELRRTVQIGAVKRELEPHCVILLLHEADAAPTLGAKGQRSVMPLIVNPIMRPAPAT